jgi:hypothetical protein
MAERSHTMTHQVHAEKEQRPIRAAVFSRVEDARLAVSRLLAAGFTQEQITVVSSDPDKARQFHEFEHQEPAGSNTQEAAATGSAIGAALGGVAAGTIGVATGGLPLIVAGGLGFMAGAVWGGFIGAMMTRGIEKEVANFYDQEVQEGKLLVAVEACESGLRNLDDADRILADSGADPIPLPEG